jgi:tetratricopeptide (TPR) repeat protein
MGLIIQREGDLAKAEKYYRMAIESNPKNLMAHNNLGVVLMKKGEPDAAAEEFRASGLSLSFANLGILYKNEGKMKEVPKSKRFKAVQIGGSTGNILPASLLETPLSHKTYLGCGAVEFFSSARDIIDVVGNDISFPERRRVLSQTSLFFKRASLPSFAISRGVSSSPQPPIELPSGSLSQV